MSKSKPPIRKPKYTLDEWIALSKQNQKNEIDYSKLIHPTKSSYGVYRCIKHNFEYKQLGLHHLNGVNSCKHCKKEKMSIIGSSSRQVALKKFNKIYENLIIPNLDNFELGYKEILYYNCYYHGQIVDNRRRFERTYTCKMCQKEKKNNNYYNKKQYYQLVKWYTEYNWKHKQNYINIYGLTRGKDIHLDHEFPIIEGFRQNIDPKIIGHWSNLVLRDAKDNIKKSSSLIFNNRCIITKEFIIDKYNNIINRFDKYEITKGKNK